MIKAHNSLQVHAVLMLISVTVPVYGAQWTATAGVAPAVTYTDNVCLSSEDEQGEWIALVTPDVGVTANGNRANLSLNASLEMNSLSDDRIEELGCSPQNIGNRTQFAPRLNASADVILMENWFFFDADAHVDQNAVSPFVAGGGDSLNRTGNTNTTSRYAVSPYLSHRFKDAADLLLRYTWDEELNSTDLVRDSTQESVLFTLGSNPTVASLFWGVQADYSNVKYGGGALDVRDAPDSELSSARVSLGYQFNRIWQINGYYGKEKNDFVSFSDEIDGDFWDVGLLWTPNARTTVAVGTGDRFFGATPRFSVNHRHKHSTFSASYSRDLTYDRNIRALGDTPVPGGEQTTLSTSPILDDRFTLAYQYEGRRSTLSVDASHSDQTRTDNGRDSTFKRASISLSRNLARNMSVSGGVSWDEQIPQGDRSQLITESETWRANLGLQRTLSDNVNLSLDYTYTDRQSDSAFNEYVENRITLNLRIAL